MHYRSFQHGTLNLFPQNMKPAMLAQANRQFFANIALKITDFQREFPMKPSSAIAQSHPNIALAM